jgi:hypothetical protein
VSDKLNPCPFCGSQDGYNLQDGDTYRWWDVMCADCSEQVAACHSDRRTHIGGIRPDRWEPADEAWNAASQHAADLRARAESAEAERDAIKETLYDEMNENLRLRELGGAGPDENITAMTERIIAERDRLRELCAAAYQVIGAADGPVQMLDNLSAGACGQPMPHEPMAGLPWESNHDRLRDALIACRPAVLRDFDRYRMMMPTEEAKRIAALLDTIDAAAKGQG